MLRSMLAALLLFAAPAVAAAQSASCPCDHCPCGPDCGGCPCCPDGK